jgi:hypothetical protein
VRGEGPRACSRMEQSHGADTPALECMQPHSVLWFLATWVHCVVISAIPAVLIGRLAEINTDCGCTRAYTTRGPSEGSLAPCRLAFKTGAPTARRAAAQEVVGSEQSALQAVVAADVELVQLRWVGERGLKAVLVSLICGQGVKASQV